MVAVFAGDGLPEVDGMVELLQGLVELLEHGPSQGAVEVDLGQGGVDALRGVGGLERPLGVAEAEELQRPGAEFDGLLAPGGALAEALGFGLLKDEGQAHELAELLLLAGGGDGFPGGSGAEIGRAALGELVDGGGDGVAGPGF